MSTRVYAIQLSLTAPYDESKSQRENLEVLKAAITIELEAMDTIQIAQNTFSAVVRSSPVCPNCGGESPFHFAGCRRDPNAAKTIEAHG